MPPHPSSYRACASSTKRLFGPSYTASLGSYRVPQLDLLPGNPRSKPPVHLGVYVLRTDWLTVICDPSNVLEQAIASLKPNVAWFSALDAGRTSSMQGARAWISFHPSQPSRSSQPSRCYRRTAPSHRCRRGADRAGPDRRLLGNLWLRTIPGHAAVIARRARHAPRPTVLLARCHGRIRIASAARAGGRIV